jgi:hypothetical protein
LQSGRDDLDHPLSTACTLAAKDDGFSLKGVGLAKTGLGQISLGKGMAHDTLLKKVSPRRIVHCRK